ncbi:uncharacterized protein LOC109721320 isoform X2 [Ananas comosus]|nr:uncharacterized protein LOC109721320 isoform X2 [Ananas comosus]XP_020104463.1 uncharacterized protein LOC109721320 isoform X2 [Ananas comosus]
MLVAALMDIITSNCDSMDHSFRSLLPGNADIRDIAAAIEVVEHGGMQFGDHNSDNDDDDDGDTGIKGIGIKVLGGTTIMGFSGGNSISESQKPKYELELAAYNSRGLMLQENFVSYPKFEKLTSGTVPGLWDDLQREHVAVPFATWALANWALASNVNRSHIQELDCDGHAVMTALTASERTVKWHGCLVAHALLADQNLPSNHSVSDWSSSLLSTAFHASRSEDSPLAQLALSTILVSIERCNESKVVVREKGLDLMREISKLMEKQKDLQELISRVLDLLYTKDSPLSLEECQRWSGIVLRWIFGQFQSETTQLTAMRILSRILEDNGPAAIPISQGWLTMLLTEVLACNKISNSEGSSPPKPDKVKNQIEQSNIYSATQVANELASAVIKLAGIQSESEPESSDKLPLADFFSLEPFVAPLKSLKKGNLPKFDAADSALATLKAVKALAELCSEDAACQHKVSRYGVLFLLRRFLLGDDYEKLAANEAYDASRVLEAQEGNSAGSGDSSTSNPRDPSSIRVPPTMHLRRHAARLLNILSLLPNTKRAIAADEILREWLEDCASGRIPCNDVKLQSYCRSALLNIFCPEMVDMEGVSDEYPNMDGEYKRNCPQYGDMLFFLNPELPSYINSVRNHSGSADSHSSFPLNNECFEIENSNCSSSLTEGEVATKPTAPLLDIVFVHGIRGGPFNSWRIADNKSSTTSKAGLVESVDQEAGKEGTCWPREWLSVDFPHARLFTVKYKTNLTQWSGASLPLQEVSSMLLRKLIAAGIGSRPVVFITHSMGGLVVKQMLYHAKLNNFNKFLNNTVGIVFYSCPHFGSKLADVPCRMGLVFRPAPSIGELRSGSPRLVELNDFVRRLNNKGVLEVLSFSETKVTPIVEGYGGWALRMEIVPIESAYPGYGELVVLDATDHINSCKPVNRTDPSYSETLEFLKKLLPRLTGQP